MGRGGTDHELEAKADRIRAHYAGGRTSTPGKVTTTTAHSPDTPKPRRSFWERYCAKQMQAVPSIPASVPLPTAPRLMQGIIAEYLAYKFPHLENQVLESLLAPKDPTS